MSSSVIELHTINDEYIDEPGQASNAFEKHCDYSAQGTATPKPSDLGRSLGSGLNQTSYTQPADGIQFSSALVDLLPVSSQLLKAFLPGPIYWWSPGYRVSLLQQWAEETLRRPKRSMIGDCYAIAILCRCEQDLHYETEIVINFGNSLRASAMTTTHAAVIQALKLSSQESFDCQAESSLIDVLRRSACANALSKLVSKEQLENIWSKDLVCNFLQGWGASESLLRRAMSIECSAMQSPTCTNLPQLVKINRIVVAQDLLEEYKIEEMLAGHEQLCLSQRIFTQVIISLSALESDRESFGQGLNREMAFLRLISITDYLRKLSAASHSNTEISVLYRWIGVIEGHLSSSRMHEIARMDKFQKDLSSQMELVEYFLGGAYLCEN